MMRNRSDDGPETPTTFIHQWRTRHVKGDLVSSSCVNVSVGRPLQVERCNYFLHACVETAQRKEAVDGRLVQFLLSNPTNDGGQWDMLVNLIGQSSPSAVLLIDCGDTLMGFLQLHSTISVSTQTRNGCKIQTVTVTRETKSQQSQNESG